MEQEQLPVTLSESTASGDTTEDMGKVTLECYLVVLMQVQCLRYTTRLYFSEVCHLVLNPVLLISAEKLQLHGVAVCSGWGRSRGEMYCIV